MYRNSNKGKSIVKLLLVQINHYCSLNPKAVDLAAGTLLVVSMAEDLMIPSRRHRYTTVKSQDGAGYFWQCTVSQNIILNSR